MADPIKKVALLHEVFVLDAELERPLKKDGYAASTKKLVAGLMKALKMKPLGKLEIYLATDKSAPGWSFIQPITTSHISGHYFEKPGKFPHVHIDVYSCKKFSYKKVIQLLHRDLRFRSWSANFVVRSTKHSSRKVCGIEGIGGGITKKYCLVQKNLVS